MQIHATLIEAPTLADASLPDGVRAPSTDVQHLEVSRVGIDDARRVMTLAAQRPVRDPYRTFVIACSGMTTEAQNALLKLFEEPPQQVRFYVVVPHTSVIIPTLRSRFVETLHTNEERTDDEAIAFLTSSYADRLSRIASLHQKKDTDGMIVLARSVCRYIADHSEDYTRDMLADTLFVESQIGARGASKKMLLEQLALTVPIAAKRAQ